MKTEMPLVVTHYPGIERLHPAFLHRLDAAARARGWSTDDLLGQIYLESRFDPGARNPLPGQTAAGLIQMIDATARQYAGVSADTLATWDELQQLPSIVDYYDVGRPLSGADFRLIGYSRGARLTAPDDAYLYAPSSGAGHVNEGVSDGSGGITYGAVRSEWRVGVENKKAAWGRYEVPRLPVSTGAGLIPLLLLAAWVAWKRGI